MIVNNITVVDNKQIKKTKERRRGIQERICSRINRVINFMMDSMITNKM